MGMEECSRLIYVPFDGITALYVEKRTKQKKHEEKDEQRLALALAYFRRSEVHRTDTDISAAFKSFRSVNPIASSMVTPLVGNRSALSACDVEYSALSVPTPRDFTRNFRHRHS